MTKRSITPPAFRDGAERLRLSPAVATGSLVFLTGVTGSQADGHMPDDPETQFRTAFEKIRTVLGEANLTLSSIVEMTTYHVGIDDHFDIFSDIRAEFVEEPWPAWTAVEVAGLRREGALVEIRVVASIADAAH